MSTSQRLKELTGREYLPMAATIAMWAVVVAAIGHADAARLLAAITAVRAIWLLTKFATVTALKRRLEAPVDVQRQARRFAFNLQATALVVALILVVLLAETLKSIGQHQIAAFLPFIALGMPARSLRFVDVRTTSPYIRLVLSGGSLAIVLLGWVAGWHAAAMGLAFGAREWITYVVLRWWPRPPRPTKIRQNVALRFEEVARYSAIVARRLLTYRLSKSLLTVFGPFGAAAARTGRGLNWDKKIEPYLPHHLGGFVLFSTGTLSAAVFLALRSGEPAAMVLSAGLLQIGAAAGNVIMLWRYLPAKGGESVVVDDDDE